MYNVYLAMDVNVLVVIGTDCMDRCKYDYDRGHSSLSIALKNTISSIHNTIDIKTEIIPGTLKIYHNLQL